MGICAWTFLPKGTGLCREVSGVPELAVQDFRSGVVRSFSEGSGCELDFDLDKEDPGPGPGPAEMPLAL